MTKIFGRVYTMKALVIIGNGQGLGGFGVGQAPLFKTNIAILRAIRRATNRLFYIERLEDRTIYQVLYSFKYVKTIFLI